MAKEAEQVQQPPPISVELGEKEAEGIYSNVAFIAHSSSEFIIDFARVLPGSRKPKVYARIVMTPQHVKSLHKALKENIERYENAHGAITEVGKPTPGKGIGF
jgi:hypothetical protein